MILEETKLPSGSRVTKRVLGNGLRVIVLEDSTSPVFAYQTWFDVGSRDEHGRKTGLAHLFEHLMFKGTPCHPEGRIDAIVEAEGGSLNAATYVDWTYYRTSLPCEAFPLIPPLEADRMQHLLLTQQQVATERDIVANEREYRVDNSPWGSMYEAMYKLAYTVHAYRAPVLGWMEDIRSITASDCLDFYRTFYVPNNAVVVVAGGIPAEEAYKQIESAYADIPSLAVTRPCVPTEPTQEEERRITIEKPIPSEKLMTAFHIPDGRHPDFVPVCALNALLFSGKSSRLYRRLLQTEEIASSAAGFVNQNKEPGLHGIDVSLRPGRKAAQAEGAVAEELLRLQREAVSDSELAKTLNRVETSFWRQFRTVGDKAHGLGFYETAFGDYRLLFEEIPRFARVTPDDVLRVANRYYNASNRTTVVGVPMTSPANDRGTNQ